MASRPQTPQEAKTDGTGIAMAVGHASSDKPYLGNLDVVSDVFRKLAGDIIERIIAVSEGKMTADAAGAKDEAEVKRLLKEFRGKGDMEPVGPWNTGNGLANFIRRTMPEGLLSPAAMEDADLALREALAIFVLTIRGAVEDAWETADNLMEDCEGVCNDWSRMFVGMPADEEGEGA